MSACWLFRKLHCILEELYFLFSQWKIKIWRWGFLCHWPKNTFNLKILLDQYWFMIGTDRKPVLGKVNSEFEACLLFRASESVIRIREFWLDVQFVQNFKLSLKKSERKISWHRQRYGTYKIMYIWHLTKNGTHSFCTYKMY